MPVTPTDRDDLDDDVAELSSEGDGINTDIASFFDAGYVSPNQVGSDVAKRARRRSTARSGIPPHVMRR